MVTSLRGASADAAAALEDQFDSTLRGGADAATMGDELFAVATLLRTEASLRRVATDVSVDAEAKQALIRQILGGKVSDGVVELTSAAAARRWTRARDLADTLEHLSEVAIVRSAGNDSQRLVDELFAFDQVVVGNSELRNALSDPARSVDDKVGLVDSLLAGKALPATVTLAKQALAGTYRTVGVALSNYQQVAAQAHDQRVATVRVAHPLSDADRQRLADALSRQYDRQLHLNVVIDPEVIGGIKVEVGDDVIDGTVASRLDEARRKLAG